MSQKPKQKSQDSKPSQPPKKRPASRAHQRRGSKITAGQVVASLAVVAIAGYACFSLYRSLAPIDQEHGLSLSDESQSTEPTEAPTEGRVYESVSTDNAEADAGNLMLVNNDYGYTEDIDGLANIYEYKTTNNLNSFHISGSEIYLQEDALAALTEMLDAFYNATGHDDIIILDGHRTHETQQSLYDADLAETGLDYSERVAQPGHSEHECGYAVDLSLYQDGYINDYDGSGDYSWINENCKRYGYILRYTEEKTDLTSIQAEPWHYRYIGQPHATYIMDNNLCLEEYILLLTGYDSNTPLRITNWDDKVYEVYYVPADTAAESTYVMVPPDQEYTISGTNIGGFIVTVDTGETQTYTPPSNTTQDSTTDTTDTDTDTDADGETDGDGDAATEDTAAADATGDV